MSHPCATVGVPIEERAIADDPPVEPVPGRLTPTGGTGTRVRCARCQGLVVWILPDGSVRKTTSTERHRTQCEVGIEEQRRLAEERAPLGE